MSRYRFELATRDDDAGLRRVLAATPMEGHISLRLLREPGFWDAAVVHGPFHQTVVARDTQSGQIVGLGMRSVREMFLNGAPTPIGYLGTLRLLPEYRRRGLLARGYALFRELHTDGRTPLYITTIAEGNQAVIRTLTSGKAGLPHYHFAGRYLTLAIAAGRSNRPANPRGIEIQAATVESIPAVIDFLHREGRRRQFFPCFSASDFFHEDGTFRNLEPDDLLLAMRGGELVGVLGTWNQTLFKQAVICGYSNRIRWTRPWYNAWAALSRRPPLPRAGSELPSAVAAVPVVTGNDAHVWQMLIGAAARRVKKVQQGYLLVGLHERDPLLAYMQPRAVASYATRVYYVCWPDGEQLRATLDERPPYLELGTL